LTLGIRKSVQSKFKFQSVRFSYGSDDILSFNQISGIGSARWFTQHSAGCDGKNRMIAPIGGETTTFVRFPYGTFVILLVDSIMYYRLAGKPKRFAIAQPQYQFF
jgi:hypothetical protein